MSTLNYWLGKLQRLQLFGHGVKELRVAHAKQEALFNIVSVHEVDGVVYIEIE